MIVKVCGVTRREDALDAVEAGANAIGFNFYAGSPRYIAPTAAANIAKELPAAILRVGIFVNEAPARIREGAAAAGLDIAQLYGTSRVSGMRVWRAQRAGEKAETAEDETAEAVLIDTPSGEFYGGTGKTFSWELACLPGKHVILAGGLDGSNVMDAIAEALPWGVDACSRLERLPGEKDREKVRSFVQAAQAAAARFGL